MKVDDTLLLKREIMDFLRELELRKDVDAAELSMEIDKLLRSDRRAIHILLKILSRCRDPGMLDFIAFALEIADDDSITDELMEILFDEQTPPEAKFKVVSLLNLYGHDVLTFEFSDASPRIGREIDEMIDRNINEIISQADSDDETLSLIMDEIESMPRRTRIDYIRYLRDLDASGVERTLEVLGSIVGDDDVAREAIEALAQVQTTRSLKSLKAIIDRATSEPVASAAWRAFRKLLLMGVAPPDEIPAFDSSPPFLNILTPIDGKGDRILWTCRHGQKEGKVRFCGFIINSDQGLRECYGTSNLDIDYLFLAYQSLMKETSPLEVGYGYAVRILKDALKTNIDTGIPVPYDFAVWRQIFDGCDLTPQEYEVEWRCPEMSSTARETLFRHTNALFLRKEFRDWYDQSGKAIEYYVRIMGATSQDEIDEIRRSYVNDVFEPKRASIKRRLEMMSDFLSMRDNWRPAANLALIAAQKLGEDRPPLHEHPFIVEMVNTSFRLAGSFFKRHRRQ